MTSAKSTSAKPRFFSHYDKPLWDSIEAGKLAIQECASCGHYRYPPGACCPKCLSTEANWKAISGKGRILSWTTFHRQYLPEYPPPVTCVAVQLDEGPIMIGNIDSGERDKLRLDVEVELFYGEHPSGFSIPRFKFINAG